MQVVACVFYLAIIYFFNVVNKDLHLYLFISDSASIDSDYKKERRKPKVITVSGYLRIVN